MAKLTAKKLPAKKRTSNKLPGRLDYVDAFGLAPIHSCAILGKLDKSTIQPIKANISGRITMRTLMALETDGKQRDAIATKVLYRSQLFPSSEADICRATLYLLDLGKLNVQLLHHRFCGQNQSSGPPFQTPLANIPRPLNVKPKEDGEMFLKKYYLPFAYRTAQYYKSKTTDPREDLYGVITEKYFSLMPRYDPLQGYSPTALLAVCLNGAAKNELTKINQMRTWIVLAEEQYDNAIVSRNSEAGGSEQCIWERTADPSAVPPAENIMHAEGKLILKLAMGELNDQEREIMEMYSRSLTLQEIANNMAMSKTNVWETIERLKEQLRRRMEEIEDKGK